MKSSHVLAVVLYVGSTMSIYFVHFLDYAVGVFEYQKNDLHVYLLTLCMCTPIK